MKKPLLLFATTLFMIQAEASTVHADYRYVGTPLVLANTKNIKINNSDLSDAAGQVECSLVRATLEVTERSISFGMRDTESAPTKVSTEHRYQLVVNYKGNERNFSLFGQKSDGTFFTGPNRPLTEINKNSVKFDNHSSYERLKFEIAIEDGKLESASSIRFVNGKSSVVKLALLAGSIIDPGADRSSNNISCDFHN